MSESLAEAVKAERERVLAEVERLMEKFEHVATFKDGSQERVIYSAAMEVELHRWARGCNAPSARL